MATSKVPNLRALRAERRLSQPQLADGLGLSSRTILRWENGEGEPNATDLLALARFFSVSIDQLVSDLLPSESPLAKTRVAELSGPQLDYWIAKLQGLPVEMTAEGPVVLDPEHGRRAVPAFSSDPNAADPLIHRKGMHLQSLRAGAQFDGSPTASDGWVARCYDEPTAYWGATFCEAAMRAYLAALTGPFITA
jgi:transcriptional regulator with XRE-family HTH domain